MAELDPAVAAILAAQAAYPAPQSVEEARAQYDETALRFAGEPEPVAVVRDEELGGVPVRRYVPEGDGAGTVP